MNPTMRVVSLPIPGTSQLIIRTHLRLIEFGRGFYSAASIPAGFLIFLFISRCLKGQHPLMERVQKALFDQLSGQHERVHFAF